MARPSNFKGEIVARERKLQVRALAQTLNDVTINLAFTSLLLRIFINNELHQLKLYQLALMSSFTPPACKESSVR